MAQQGAFQIIFTEDYGYTKFNCGHALMEVGRRFRSDPLDQFWILNDQGKARPYFNAANDSGVEGFAIARTIIDFCRDSDGNWVPAPETLALMKQRHAPVVEFKWPGGEMRVFYPRDYETHEPLTGRIYEVFKADCYSLVRDYMNREMGCNMPVGDIEFAKSLARQFGRTFMSTALETHGFEPVADMQPGDMLICSSEGPEHIGVYLDGNLFLHHVPGRLSCIEPFSGVWKQRLSMIWRKVNG